MPEELGPCFQIKIVANNIKIGAKVTINVPFYYSTLSGRANNRNIII